MTPVQLADELGVTEEEVRRVLRSLSVAADPDPAEGELSPAVADRVRQHLAGGTAGPGSVT